MTTINNKLFDGQTTLKEEMTRVEETVEETTLSILNHFMKERNEM